jgi:dihydrolipoamide dehydrogenase
MYDIAVIGSGPAGYVAAIRGAQLGKKVCVAEKAEVGGVCLNRGCIPTKAILASVRVLRDVARAHRFGVNAGGDPSIDLLRVMKRKQTVVRRLTSGVSFLLKKNGVEVLSGAASIKETGCLRINGKEIKAKSIIICTGSSPVMPFGADIGNVVTSDEALNFESIPSRMLIVGAGAVGVEFATIFSEMGVRVTLVEMLPSILPEIKDSRITGIIRKNLVSKGVEILEGCKIEGIESDSGETISTLSSGQQIRAETVIAACGRLPNYEQFESLGLEIRDRRIVVDDRMCTSIPGIYAAGDVAGPPLLAHKASAEGIAAVENAGSNDSQIARAMDYDSVPSCVFSHPEVAWVGKFESEVDDAKTGEYMFQGVGKALCIDETTGFAKVVADGDYRIKGVQIVGPHASDLIPIGILGVKKELKVDELADIIYPHPTLSECLKEALQDVSGTAIHKV